MNNAIRLWRGIAIGLTLLAASTIFGQSASNKTFRVYLIGNSVTDTLNYKAFAQLAASRGDKQEWGRHMIPGSPMFGLWRASFKQSGFMEKPYGYSVEALENFQWDAITLQPFDRMLRHPNKEGVDEEGDVATATRFIEKALAKSPAVQFYIYARWPRVTVKGKGVPYNKDTHHKDVPGAPVASGPIDDYSDQWLRKFTGGWDGSNETQDYFETLTREVRTVNPGMKKPVLMIPVGHVMNELHQLMKAGKVPGYTNIFGLYKDGIHLNKEGSYLVGCTFFSTLYKQSPKGLPGDSYGVTDVRLMNIIQDTVWRVVRTHELAGVGPLTSK